MHGIEESNGKSSQVGMYGMEASHATDCCILCMESTMRTGGRTHVSFFTKNTYNDPFRAIRPLRTIPACGSLP